MWAMFPAGRTVERPPHDRLPRRHHRRSVVALSLAVLTTTCGSLPGTIEPTTPSSTEVAPTTEGAPTAEEKQPETAPTTSSPTTTDQVESAMTTTTQGGESTTSAADETTTTDVTTAAPSTTSTAVPVSTTADSGPATTVVDLPNTDAAEQTVRIRFESQAADVPVADLRDQAIAILNDERGWVQAGFTFISDDASVLRVVLAEGPEVDALCRPLRTGGTVSCQNGPVVALNADRWRTAVDHWDAEVADYRGYLVNHEVGHLIGLRHPEPRCPVPGRPAGVMEQQTGSLKGCTGNAWPREWELEHARQRPVIYAPLPDWGPDPVPANGEQ